MIINKIIPRLIEQASKSDNKYQLAAALIKGQKFISRPCSNIHRNICRGYTCGSLHAEASAILSGFFIISFYQLLYKEKLMILIVLVFCQDFDP